MRNGTSLMLNPANTGGENTATPPPVNDSIIAWYEANNGWDGATWNDLSGNDFHLGQYSNYPLPIYNSGEMNGNGGLVFDAASGSATLVRGNTDLGEAMHGLTDCTIFYIVRTLNPTSTQEYIFSIIGDGASELSSYSNSTAFYTFFKYTENILFRNFDYALASTNQVRSMKFDSVANTGEGGISGDIGCSNPAVGSLNLSGGDLTIAGRGPGIYPGKFIISEMLIYGRALNDSEMLIMNSYLCSKWGILDITPVADEISMMRYETNVYVSSLAQSATFTASSASHGAVSNLKDLTGSVWQTYLPAILPWIEAEWASPQTISKIHLAYWDSTVNNLAHPSYSAPFELFYWDGSVWVSVGTHDVWGNAVEIRFATPINTTKLRLELAQDYAVGNNYIIKEMLVF